MSEPVLLPHQRARERAVLLVIVLDVFGAAGVVVFGALAGSLTLLADGLRGNLLNLVEVYAWVTMRRIHRRQFVDYEFGTGKIERLVNVAIALSLLAAAAWVVWMALVHAGGAPPSSALFYAVGLLFAELNLAINLYGLVSFVRANEGDPSLILSSQIDARMVKTLSTLVVVGVVVASGLIPDPTVGSFLDAVGSLFVAAIMVKTAARQLRESLPDLLDRTLTDPNQHAVYRVLAENFHAFDDIVDVRSRRSGQQLFVEIQLGFSAETTMERAAMVQRSIAEQVRTALADAQVSVVPVLSRWQHPPATS
ncbi:MAG TPA: cation transporter [Thermoanaerobaculia bacterium]|nr:cation transporter [Thermoanaerobaculia bacterium]